MSQDAAQAQFLPVDVVAAHHALMLIDLSGPASEKPKLAAATKTMIEKVTPAMGVTVYGYDGRAELQLIGDFPKGTPAPDIDPTLLASNDPSRNLHGAIMLGLQELDARLMQQQKPVRRGNLVVLLRGPDIAGRSTLQQAQKAIERTGYNSYAVVLGQPEGVSGDEIGKTKAVDGVAGLNAAMEQAANLVVGGKMREYVLSYCSPARAGKRTVRLEVTLPPKTEEDSEKRGRLETEIDATGFAGGCDSSQPPRFVVGAAPPTEPSEAEGETPPEEQPPSPAPSAPTTPAAPPAGQGDGEEGGDIVPPPDKPGYAPQDD